MRRSLCTSAAVEVSARHRAAPLDKIIFLICCGKFALCIHCGKPEQRLKVLPEPKCLDEPKCCVGVGQRTVLNNILTLRTPQSSI